jgi:aminoglycoside phosphotransferase (APT) family kinase protein
MTAKNSPQPSSAFRLSTEQIIEGLQAWLPTQLDNAAVTIGDVIAPKGTGFSNQTFLFSAHWKNQQQIETQQEFVLQAAPVGKRLFSRYDFAGMARVQQQLGAVSNVPVARVRWIGDEGGALGVPFYIMERVAGRAPTDKPPYHRGSWFSELSPATHERVWWSGITAMVQLHALDATRDGFEFLTNAPWGMPIDANPALTRIKQWREFMAWADPEPCAPITAALLELERSAPPPPAKLSVHWGDAKLSNCMVDNSRVQALLDWELCGLSAPEEDLAHWLMLDWSLWAVTGNTRLGSLPSPQRTIERYQELSGRDTPQVLWWFRFGMVRLAIIYHRIMSLLRERGHVASTATLTDVNPMVPLMAPIFDKDSLP